MSNGQTAGSLVSQTRYDVVVLLCQEKDGDLLISLCREDFWKNSGGHSVEAAGK
jgi:hypothetical protein